MLWNHNQKHVKIYINEKSRYKCHSWKSFNLADQQTFKSKFESNYVISNLKTDIQLFHFTKNHDVDLVPKSYIPHKLLWRRTSYRIKTILMKLSISLLFHPFAVMFLQYIVTVCLGMCILLILRSEGHVTSVSRIETSAQCWSFAVSSWRRRDFWYKEQYHITISLDFHIIIYVTDMIQSKLTQTIDSSAISASVVTSASSPIRDKTLTLVLDMSIMDEIKFLCTKNFVINVVTIAFPRLSCQDDANFVLSFSSSILMMHPVPISDRFFGLLRHSRSKYVSCGTVAQVTAPWLPMCLRRLSPSLVSPHMSFSFLSHTGSALTSTWRLTCWSFPTIRIINHQRKTWTCGSMIREYLLLQRHPRRKLLHQVRSKTVWTQVVSTQLEECGISNHPSQSLMFFDEFLERSVLSQFCMSSLPCQSLHCAFLYFDVSLIVSPCFNFRAALRQLCWMLTWWISCSQQHDLNWNSAADWTSVIVSWSLWHNVPRERPKYPSSNFHPLEMFFDIPRVLRFPSSVLVTMTVGQLVLVPVLFVTDPVFSFALFVSLLALAVLLLFAVSLEVHRCCTSRLHTSPSGLESWTDGSREFLTQSSWSLSTWLSLWNALLSDHWVACFFPFPQDLSLCPCCWLFSSDSVSPCSRSLFVWSIRINIHHRRTHARGLSYRGSSDVFFDDRQDSWASLVLSTSSSCANDVDECLITGFLVLLDRHFEIRFLIYEVWHGSKSNSSTFICRAHALSMFCDWRPIRPGDQSFKRCPATRPSIYIVRWKCSDCASYRHMSSYVWNLSDSCPRSFSFVSVSVLWLIISTDEKHVMSCCSNDCNKDELWTIRERATQKREDCDRDACTLEISTNGKREKKTNRGTKNVKKNKSSSSRISNM